jgi:hypothetical protein
LNRLDHLQNIFLDGEKVSQSLRNLAHSPQKCLIQVIYYLTRLWYLVHTLSSSEPEKTDAPTAEAGVEEDAEKAKRALLAVNM